MLKPLSIAALVLLSLVTFGARAQTVTDEAICRAAGISTGNISNYKTSVFDEKPHETMQVITSAKASLARQSRYLQQKVNLAVVNAASPKSWPSVQTALLEFDKLCPCGGQSPCDTVVTNPVKVN